MRTLANSIKQSTQQRGNTKDKKGGGFKSEPKRTNKTPIPLGFVKPDLEELNLYWILAATLYVGGKMHPKWLNLEPKP
jgi:hypothetical protein